MAHDLQKGHDSKIHFSFMVERVVSKYCTRSGRMIYLELLAIWTVASILIAPVFALLLFPPKISPEKLGLKREKISVSRHSDSAIQTRP